MKEGVVNPGVDFGSALVDSALPRTTSAWEAGSVPLQQIYSQTFQSVIPELTVTIPEHSQLASFPN